MQQIDAKLLLQRKAPEEFDALLTSAPPLKWGILGLGRIADLFAREILAAGGQIHAVASRDLQKALHFQRKFGDGRYGLDYETAPGSPAANGGGRIAKAYGSYSQLLCDEEVQAVYIATPQSHHLENAREALNALKPILVEKPLACSYAEAEEMFALAKQKQLFAMEAMWTRFLPHMRKVKQIVDAGVIGEVVALFADHGQLFPYNAAHRLYDPNLGGGALLDLGVYAVNFAHYILGAPQSINASGFHAPSGVDANCSAILNYQNGALATLHTTLLSTTATTASICGTLGRIDIHAPFYRPADFTLTLEDSTRFEFQAKKEQRQLFGRDGSYGMHFQVAEVARCIAKNQTESAVMPWSESLCVLKTIDEIRAQIRNK
jgi:predicted dehydrogenase